MKSQSKLLDLYHVFSNFVKGAEDWSPIYKKDKKAFKELLKLEADYELDLLMYFNTLAVKRIDGLVDWSKYRKAIKAADTAESLKIVAAITSAAFIDEETILLGVSVDFIAGMIGTGAIAQDNISRVTTGLSPTHDAIQKAALNRSSLLVKDVTETTRNRIQTSIDTSLKLGESVDDAAKRLSSIIDDPVRAELIASTESARSFKIGMEESAKAGGAVTKYWDPSSDPCELCQANANQGPIPIDEQFENDDGDDTAHPRDRCGVVFNYPDPQDVD